MQNIPAIVREAPVSREYVNAVIDLIIDQDRTEAIAIIAQHASPELMAHFETHNPAFAEELRNSTGYVRLH